jgi:hypothetical protein
MRMKVSELIQELSQYDGDLPVVMDVENHPDVVVESTREAEIHSPDGERKIKKVKLGGFIW